MAKMTKGMLKLEVNERMTACFKLKGTRVADVTSLWEDNSAELKALFEHGDWGFVKTDGRILYKKKDKEKA